MGIKKIKINNFKSFKDLEVNLKDFNILIGANASGKSNFIHIFEFLRDIVNHGLDNAISMQGDIEYLRNINIGDKDIFSLEITLGSDKKKLHHVSTGYEVNMLETVYEFTIEFGKEKPGFKISEDKLSVMLEFSRAKDINTKKRKGAFTINNIGGEIETKLDIPEESEAGKIEEVVRTFFPLASSGRSTIKNLLLLESQHLKTPIFDFAEIFFGLPVYNFDPKLSKKAIPITGKSELEEDGSNLAIVLKNIMKDKESGKQFSNIIHDVLSFVESLDVQKFADKSLLVHLREIYSKDKLLPASFLSDGTLNVTALIIALYFGKKPFVIIEEPERNIHPHLASKIVEMMREVSRKRQIIVTTHNPEIIKHAKLDEILFISRDKDGFSQVTRPAENEQVKIFLENEMGMDELYVQNLLEL